MRCNMTKEKIKQKVGVELQNAINSVESARKTTWDLWDLSPVHKVHAAELAEIKKALIRLRSKYS